jgi:RNA polymerase sigma factor (sigma-70 family)
VGHAGVLDKQATIEVWVADYGDSVLRLAHLYLKDRYLAEDVFQDVFTRAYLNLDRFRGQSSPKTWLYRITVNLCRDRLGAWNARKVLLLGEDLLSAARSIGADTEEEAFETVDAEILLNTVLKLPIEFREVLMLAYYEGMDLREVADALNIPSGTVRSRLFRARQRLKQLLEEEGWER